MIQAEPKSTGFLSPPQIQTQSPSTNQIKTTVRSDEARQSSQVDGGLFLECSYCKRKFKKDSYRKRTFCSHKCYWQSLIGRKLSLKIRKKMSQTHKFKGTGKWMLGRKRSEETKLKLSLINKGRKITWADKISKSNKGQIPWILGKHHTEETKRKLSILHMENKNPNWKGIIITSCGYINIYNPKHPYCGSTKYVKEHRLVIEKIIGRYLTKNEIVHHLGKKDDNRPHKLMAFINQSTHQRFERNGIVKPEEIIFDGRKYDKNIFSSITS